MVSNVQYRLSEVDGGTLIAFRHTALGFVPEEHKAGMDKGWASMNEGVRRRAEAGSQQSLPQSTNRK
jgi:hypothetical protein